MRGTGFDMTCGEFSRRFVSHLASAMVALLTILLVLEKIVPGFATPFVDLPGFALGTFALIILGILL